MTERRHDVLLLLYWLLLPLAVFFLSRSRLELYILPLFVPLALLMSRALVHWPWLTQQRLVALAALTAVALLALKGAAALVPVDRDARMMAAQIRGTLDLHDVDEIAFFNMPAFFGLTLYLDVRIESVRIGGPGRAHSRRLATENELCDELDEQEHNVFALKRARTQQFAAAVSACGAYAAREIGRFHGDGREMVLFKIGPASDR